jgi:hypothetical protein
MWTLFNYLYRDVGNYKAFGCIALEGALLYSDRNAIVAKFEGGDLFVAEQIGVPVLYEQLYRWTNGPTMDDHCWHEFDGFEEIETTALPHDAAVWGRTADFVTKIVSVMSWRGELSPHYHIYERTL